jgi:protein-S-isoprenylcysteine O-methyltransferase Ste14
LNVNRWWKKHRTKLSGVLGLICLIFSTPVPKSLISGAPLILLGESIRIWSAGNILKNERLTTDGPYSLTRNPLYVGSFLMGTGFIIAMNVVWLAVVFLVFFATVYWFTIRWEEDKLKNIFAKEWKEYSQNVPRFFPLLKVPKYRKGDFGWSQVFRNKELQNASVVLAVYAILWGKALLKGQP